MSPETRAFLDAVRTAEDPTPEDQRRVLSAVRAAVATGAAVGTGLGVSKAAKLLGGGVASGVKVGAVILGLGAAAWIASTSPSAERPARPAVVPTTPQPSALRVSNMASSLPAPPQPPEAAPSSDAPRARTLPSASPGLSRSVLNAARATPAAPPSLRDELALLADVQALIARGDGAAALRRFDEQPMTERRLLAERQAARILALCLLGRTREAEQAARAFSREHPTSVQRTAVERSCAGEATDPR